MTVSERGPERILLVEGQDDSHIVTQLCERVGLPVDFRIKEKGGVQPLLDSISVEVVAPGLQALGIVADANADHIARWQAIRDRLARRRVELPVEPVADGAVVDGKPRVGVWLMPTNSGPGQIEDLIAGMIPPDDPVWRAAQNFVTSLPETERPKPIIKAQVRTWLAIRAEGRPMGFAIGAGRLDTSSPAAAPFLNWLQHLFHDSVTGGT